MSADKAKHLEFVQSAISRMATNSFVLKGWTVTLVAALFALAAKDSNRRFALLALFPALTFWGLDAYYLRQERLFRNLYDKLRGLSAEEYEKADPFSMSTAKHSHEVAGWFRTLWAPTIFFLHGVVVAAVLVVIALLSR
jgi:hypothetical protein